MLANLYVPGEEDHTEITAAEDNERKNLRTLFKFKYRTPSIPKTKSQWAAEEVQTLLDMTSMIAQTHLQVLVSTVLCTSYKHISHPPTLT